MRVVIDRELGCFDEILDMLAALKSIDARLPEICAKLMENR